MKTTKWNSSCATGFAYFASLVLLLPRLSAAAILQSSGSTDAEATTTDGGNNAEPRATSGGDVVIDPAPQDERKNVAWLGVSTMEASEALASQLDLAPGVGLVVTYVAPDSPAAKSGLRKNDVLVEFADQSLVHPAQLRKLVRVRQEGQTVKLGFFRAGKHASVSITLGRTASATSPWDDEERALKGNLKELHRQFNELHIDQALRDQMRALRESLGNIKIDQKEVQENIHRGMEEARKAIHDALRNVTNSDPIRKVLENLAHSGVIVDDKANVVVRSSGKNVSSVVKSDDSGTIVLVRNPRMYLTAHDKDGNLLFDGPIESPDERSKVPPAVWERVEPLLDQLRIPAEQTEPESQ